jgi:sporulation-control protein spo0M
MKYSKLGHEIEVMKLNHNHELQLLKMKQDLELRELKGKCAHTYDNGESAKRSEGSQWDLYYTCNICEKTF